MSDLPEEKKPQLDQRVWEQGWDGHELEQQKRLARLSLAEKLQWLEDAHRIAIQLQASREKNRGRG